MDPSVIAQVADAVMSSMSSASLQTTRAEAFQYLASFEAADPQSMVQVALELVNHSEPQVRHYGLRALQSAVAYGWSSFSDTDKEALKNVTLQLIEGSMAGEPAKFVKEKAVDVAIQIAVYEWPYQWPELLDFLSGLCGSGFTPQAELALLTLRSLVEKVGILNGNATELNLGGLILSEHITASRAKQLNAAAITALPQLYDLAAALLAAAVSSGEPVAEPAADPRSAVLFAVVDLTRALFEYMALDLLGAEGCGLLALLAAALALPGMMTTRHSARFRVLDAMLVLVSREHAIGDGARGVCRLFESVPTLLAAYDAAGENLATGAQAAGSTEHVFRAQVADVLALLGLFAIRVNRRLAFSKATGVELHSGFASYLGDLVRLAEGSVSLRVCEAVSNVWLGYLQLGNLDVEIHEGILRALLPIAAAFMAMPNPLTQPAPAPFVASIDCDSEDDIKKSLKRLHRRGSALMRAITRSNGLMAVGFLAEYVAFVFQSVLAGSAHLSGAVCTNDSIEWQSLNAAALMADATLNSLRQVMLAPLAATAGGAAIQQALLESVAGNHEAAVDLDRKADEEAAVRGEVVASLGALLDGVLEFETPSPHLKARHIALVEAFSPYLQHHQAALPAVFNLFVGMVTYRQPSEAELPLDALCGTTVSTRERAAHATLSLAVHAGQGLAGVMQELWDHVHALASAGQLLRTEVVSLYQAILVVLATGGDAESQHAVVGLILEPVLSELAGEVWPLVESPEALLTAVGLAAEPTDGVLFSEAAVRARERLFYLVSVLRAVVRHAEKMAEAVLGHHIEAMAHVVFTLCRTLAALWTPGVAAALPAVFQAVVGDPEVSPEDDALAARIGVGSLAEPPETQLATARWWLQATHVHAIEILAGLLRNAAVYALPGIGGMLFECVFADMASLPLGTLRVLVASLVMAVRRTVPEAAKGELLLPLIQPLLEVLHARLAAEWAQYAERERARMGGGDGGGDDGGERAASGLTDAQEIMRDNELRGLTAALGSLLRSLAFRIETLLAGGAEAAAAGVELPREAVHLVSEPVAPLFIGLVNALLQWPAPAGMATGVYLCERLIMLFGDQPAFLEGLGSVTLPALVGVLSVIDEPGVVRNALDVTMLLYSALAPSAGPALAAYLCSLPGVTPESLGEFERVLATPGATPRQHSNALKKLLMHVIGAAITASLFKKEVAVVDTLSGPNGPADTQDE